MTDFITDVERQYELYCKIAEEHGFIDLNAKKNDFRCTTKSNEFNAGWIAFVGAVAAVRDEQQARIDELNQHIKRLESKLDSLGADRQELVGQVNDLQKQNAWLSDVAERENKRANNLQQDKTSTTILLGKTIREKNELQKRIDEYKKLTISIRNEFDLWSDDSEFADVIEAQIENLEALRGAND
jgi:chromosome segregation ATPase